MSGTFQNGFRSPDEILGLGSDSPEPRPRRRGSSCARPLGLLMVCLLALSISCGDDESAVGAPSSRTGDSSPDAIAKNSQAAATHSEVSGSLLVEKTSNGLRVLAREARRSAVLEEMGRVANFQVVLRAGRDPRIDYGAEDLPADQIVRDILSRTAFALEYKRDPMGDSVLARLVLSGGARGSEVVKSVAGSDDPQDGENVEDSLAAATSGSNSRKPEPLPEWRRRELLEARDAREERRRAVELEALERADPATRRSIVAMLDPDEPNEHAALERVAKFDGNPLVRREALIQLVLSDEPARFEVFENALQDPAPEVLTVAIEGLSWADDSRYNGEIAKYLSHPNADVRRGAENALRQLGQ